MDEIQEGDVVLVSMAYTAIVKEFNDDGSVTVFSESTGRTYTVDIQEIERV